MTTLTNLISFRRFKPLRTSNGNGRFLIFDRFKRFDRLNGFDRFKALGKFQKVTELKAIFNKIRQIENFKILMQLQILQLREDFKTENIG